MRWVEMGLLMSLPCCCCCRRRTSVVLPTACIERSVCAAYMRRADTSLLFLPLSVPDVTAYCCGAVGGILEEYDTEDRLVATSAPGAASTRASNASATGTGVGEPECETTNYRDSE